MSPVLQNALRFLVLTLFNLYLFILGIRLILVWAGTDYWHPFTQFIVKMTRPLIDPLRRILPNYQKIETATLVLIVVLETLKLLILALLSIGLPHILGLMLIVLADTLNLFIQIFFYAILLQALLSWLQPGSEINRFLIRITYPVLKPFQRLIPPISGIDLSPLAAIIVLQLLIIVLIDPLRQLGIFNL